MESQTILIAEDDPEVRQALERILGFEGYVFVSVADGAAALDAVKSHHPALILLDVMMPFVDGLEVCRTLRSRGDRTPILMLTAREEVPDRVAGLDAGADDYVAKPFALDELLARIRALLRRNEPDTGDTFEAHGLGLDIGRRIASRDGREIDLTKTEFELLELLLRNDGLVLSRSTIYERVWGYDFGEDSKSLDVHISYLRRKLEEDGEPRLIQTVRGVGYVLRPGSDQ
jgi:two-component system response regulator MprA